jgi:hypothetical protein
MKVVFNSGAKCKFRIEYNLVANRLLVTVARSEQADLPKCTKYTMRSISHINSLGTDIESSKPEFKGVSNPLLVVYRPEAYFLSQIVPTGLSFDKLNAMPPQNLDDP